MLFASVLTECRILLFGGGAAADGWIGWEGPPFADGGGGAVRSPGGGKLVGALGGTAFTTEKAGAGPGLGALVVVLVDFAGAVGFGAGLEEAALLDASASEALVLRFFRAAAGSAVPGASASTTVTGSGTGTVVAAAGALLVALSLALRRVVTFATGAGGWDLLTGIVVGGIFSVSYSGSRQGQKW